MTDYNELAGGPRESLGEDSGPGAERLFLIDHATRISAFIPALVSSSAFPGLGHCRAQSVTFEPFSGDLVPVGAVNTLGTDIVSYAGIVCLARVNYGPTFFSKTWPTDVPKPGGIRANTQLRLRIRGSGQFLTIPGRKMKWSTASSGSIGGTEAASTVPTPPDMNGRILIPTTEFHVQWDFVDDPPVDTLRTKIGHVFSAAFLGSPSECLLFENYEIDDSFKLNATNPHTHRVSCVFRERKIQAAGGPFGWNHDYREDPAGWTRVIMDGKPRYPLADPANFFA